MLLYFIKILAFSTRLRLVIEKKPNEEAKEKRQNQGKKIKAIRGGESW